MPSDRITQRLAEPTHIIEVPGARRTRCGLTGDKRYPYVVAAAVPAHIEGCGMIVCATCAQGGWPTDD